MALNDVKDKAKAFESNYTLFTANKTIASSNDTTIDIEKANEYTSLLPDNHDYRHTISSEYYLGIS